MFHESQRIIDKNLKYEKMKANNLILDLEQKGMSPEEIIGAIKILSEDENTEFQASVFKRAIVILKASKEITDERDANRSNAGSVDISIDCPILRDK